MSENNTDTPKNSFIFIISFAVFVLFIISSILVGYFVWDISSIEERLKNEMEALKTTATIFGGIAVFINAYYAAKRWEAMDKSANAANKSAEAALQNAKAAQDKQITERFAKAIEQLGNEKIETRLGAIYTLERIAKDSKDDYWTIMEVLTAFVRENAPLKNCSEKKNTENTNLLIIVNSWNTPKAKQLDILAALTVIGRRKLENDPEKQKPDLRNLDIREVDLTAVKLPTVDFTGANLQGAILSQANLQGTTLSQANLQEANFKKANLQRAELTGANLQGTELTGANLQGAELTGASLDIANLTGANLQETNLNDAELKGAFLMLANLQGAFLISAKLQGASIWKANLKGAFLMLANLQGADFSDTDLQGADIRGADLQGAILSQANLHGAYLSKAENLEQQQIESAKGDRTTILPDNLQYPEHWK